MNGAPLDAVHGVEDVFPLNANVHAKPLTLCVQRGGVPVKRHDSLLNVYEHNHGEHAAEDRLADVQNVDVDVGERDADARDDSNAVVADDGNNGMHGWWAPIRNNICFVPVSLTQWGWESNGGRKDLHDPV